MNILLVDDHAIVRDGLRRLLQAARGDVVHEAADGHAALDAVAARRMDLVILDLNLPGLGGLELVRRLVALGERVLVLSMHAEPLYARVCECLAAEGVSVVERGRYLAPTAPGFSARMHDATLRRFRFPDGPEWTETASE